MSDNLAPPGTAPVLPGGEEHAPGLQPEPTTNQQASPSRGEPQAEEQPAAEVPPAQPQAAAATEPAQEQTPEEAQARSAQRAGMRDVFADEYAYQRPKRGEIREGQIIAIREDSIVVDLGIKREGIIPGDDLQRVGPEVADKLSVGEKIPVYVLRTEDDKEGILVSLYRARQEQDWIDAQRLHQTGEIWEGMVKGYNRGGLIVTYGKIRGFIPASQITGVSRRMDPATLQARLAEMVGETMPLKVIEVDRENRRLIFSERTARREWRSQQRDKLLDELKEGDHVHGVVSNVCDFGVFVDVGGTDGLVHISELSWRRTGHPSELLKVGDEVEAYVLRVDKERKRIGLSLRLAEPDPWENVEEKYQLGQLVSGVITKLAAFGAFAALNDGIEGLIHISELAEVAPKHPDEVVTAGMAFPLCIVKIDRNRRRMGLSLRRVPEDELARWEEQRRAATAREPEVPPAPAGEAAPAEEAAATSTPEPEVTPAPPSEVEAGPASVSEAEAAPAPETREAAPEGEPSHAAEAQLVVAEPPAEQPQMPLSVDAAPSEPSGEAG